MQVVISGLFNAEERKKKIQLIDLQAEHLENIADQAARGNAKYKEFEVILHELHKPGFYPAPFLVSNVAQVFLGK